MRTKPNDTPTCLSVQDQRSLISSKLIGQERKNGPKDFALGYESRYFLVGFMSIYMLVVQCITKDVSWLVVCFIQY